MKSLFTIPALLAMTITPSGCSAGASLRHGVGLTVLKDGGVSAGARAY